MKKRKDLLSKPINLKKWKRWILTAFGAVGWLIIIVVIFSEYEFFANETFEVALGLSAMLISAFMLVWGIVLIIKKPKEAFIVISAVAKPISNYLPDALINMGIWIYAYSSLVSWEYTIGFDSYLVGREKYYAVVMITLGINIAVRRYLARKR